MRPPKEPRWRTVKIRPKEDGPHCWISLDIYWAFASKDHHPNWEGYSKELEKQSGRKWVFHGVFMDVSTYSTDDFDRGDLELVDWNPDDPSGGQYRALPVFEFTYPWVEPDPDKPCNHRFSKWQRGRDGRRGDYWFRGCSDCVAKEFKPV